METATDYFLKNLFACFCKEGTRVIFVLPVNRSFFLSTSSHAPRLTPEGYRTGKFFKGHCKILRLPPLPHSPQAGAII